MEPCPWFDVLLREVRNKIAMEFLDFVSLVALSLTSWRTLRDTQLVRGLRMAAPLHPERMPRLSHGMDDNPALYPVYALGLRHLGYFKSYVRHVPMAIADAAKYQDVEAMKWLAASFHDEVENTEWEPIIGRHMYGGWFEAIHLILEHIRPVLNRMRMRGWMTARNGGQAGEKCREKVLAYDLLIG